MNYSNESLGCCSLSVPYPNAVVSSLVDTIFSEDYISVKKRSRVLTVACPLLSSASDICLRRLQNGYNVYKDAG